MAENTKISDDEILSAFKSEQAAVSEPVYSKEEAKGISDEALLSAFRGNAPEMQTAGGTLSGGGGMFQPEMIGGTAPAEQSALVVSGPLGSGKFSNIPVGPKGKFDEYAGIVDPDTRKGIAETVFKNITDPKDLKELQEKVPWYDMSGNPTQVKSLFLHEWSEKTDPFELVGSAAQAGVGMLQSLPPLVTGAGRLAKDIVGGLTYDWDGDPSGLTQAKVLTEQQRKGLSEQQIRDAELSAPDKLIRASRVAGDAILEAEEQLRTAVANFAENKSMLWDKAKVGFASAPDYGDFSGLTATPETEQEAQARRAAKTAELMEEAEKNFAARLNAKHVEYLHREKNPAVLARDIEAVWKYPAVKTFATNVMELMMPPAEDAAPGFGGDMQAAKANRRAQAAEAAEVGVQAAIAESNRLQEDPEQVGAIAMTTPLNVVGAGAMLFGGLNRASQALARGLKAIGKTDQEINAMFSAELAAARAQAEAAAMAREQPGRIERALGSTADTFDKAKAAFAQVPVPAQYIGMAGLGGLAGAVTADDPLTGFLEGAGTGAAGRLGMKIGGGALLAAPRLGQELIKAGRLAGAEMGRFEALERLGSASPEVAKFVNWSQKVGGGNVMDFIEQNASVFVQHNVSMLPMMVALGVLEDKDAKEFAQMWAEFATYGFIHGQVLGGILGNDPVRMRMDREANMRQAQRVVNSLSPESRENVRNLTWDRVVEQSEARVEQARAAAEAQLAADPNSPEAAEAQTDYNFANQLHRQNLIAPPEARAAFEDGIRLSLAQASNLINGVLTPNSNMNIELLTTQQIYDKMIAANPNYNGVGAPLTIEQAMAMNPGADGAKIGKGISDSGFTMDAAKDTVFVNLDNALAKGRLSGEAIPNVIAHEVVGHGLFAKSEYRQKIAPLYNKMFGTEVMDENGNWQQITPAEPGLSREDLLEKFFNKYLEGKTPESVAQYAEAAGVWDKANNTFDNNKVVELMREEVLAEAHAGRFYGNPESPLQRGIGWLASRISGGNLKTALNHLYSVAGPAVYAQWTSGVTGATYSPEVMRAIRNVEREMKKYDGDFTDAEPGEAVAAPITRKDVIKSPEMLNKYFKDTGKFETTPVAVVTDAEGNVVQSVKLTDNEAFEGSWNYQQNEATGDNVPNRESGFGDIPAEVAGIQVPVGGRVQVKRQIAYDEATGKPIERKNKATVEYLKRRVQMLRDAIDNAGDPSQLGRFRAIKGGQGKDDEDLHYTGKMTPEQRSAIAALPESVVPSSIKELLLKYDDLMTRGDGTVLDIDYASRLNDKGNYQAFSPKIRQIVPLQLHLSMAGNFYTTAWDISDLRRKVRLYEKYAKGVFEPWGGDTQKFWNEFRTILLPNLTNPDPNVPGWQGLDADPNVAKLKRTIYEKMLGAPNPNVPGVEAIPELSREKFSRSEKKLDKQSSFDQIIKSFRLDSVTAAEENANSDFKYPIPYKARFLPEQEAGGTGAQMRFQPEGKEDPTNVAPGFYSKAGRLLLGKMGGRASAEQLKGMLDPQKGSGVKPDELKRSGIIQFIDATQAEKGFITKEDVNKFLTENYAAKFETKTMRPSRSMSEDFEFYSDNEEWGSVSAKFKTIEEAVNAAQEMFGMDRREAEVFVWDTNEADSAYTPNETEYSSYTLPGGKNYKEVVLQVPGTKFVSSHFSDVPDYVAHLRTAEHGNGLLIEEIQSDLHQKAREIGYSEPVPLEETLRALNESLAAAKEERSNIFEVRKLASSALRDITKPTQELSFVEQGVVKWANEKIANYPKEIDRINAGIEATEKEIEDYTFGRKVKTSGGVPDAPFRKDWPLQLFKYALKDAVATGKEWIGWTAGEQQAERYDLSEQVDSVNYDPLNKRLIAVKDGQRISDQSNIPKEKLADYIGKDLANKLLQPDTLNGAGNHVLSGIDLKVGGEGMKGFYDTMLPKEIGKYVKQWGGKVEPSVLEGAYKDYSIKGNPHIAETMSFSSKENAEAMLASRGRGKGGEIVGNGEVPKIWKIAITPEMQESVAGGQARFMPAKLDAEYTAAFEAKDEQKARALVDEVAKKAGYNYKVHRGVENDYLKGDGYVFGKADQTYFTGNRALAETYANFMGQSPEGVVYDTYLRLENPWIPEDINDAANFEYNAKRLREKGYDGVIGSYGGIEGAKNGQVDVAVAFDPSQIKSADPFTYDNEGKLIPLSERFNVGTGDIRFMPPKEEEPEKARQRSSLRVRMTREALTDAALSQASWKDWYSEHQETLDNFFGDMAPLFQNILAITSQAASVKANVGLALKAFGQLMRGEEFTGYLPAVAGNLGKLRDAAGPSGQKIQAYKAANEGDASSVVVDRHIARMLFGVDTPTPKQFAKAAKVLTQIAEKIGWTPAQVQAALWAHSIVQSGKQPESYGNYLKRLESQGGITKRIGSLGEGSAGADVVGGPRGRYSPNDEGSLSRVAPVGEQGAEARFMPNVAVVPERFTGTGEEEQRRGRYVEPPKFFKRFNISQYEPGGKFFDAETGEDLTNKSYENASIAVVDGKPTLVANNEAEGTGSGPLFRTNLFKQKAGWKWVSEGAPDTSTIVSVEGQGKHLYALQADFQNGVTMARYPDKASEPRLRPTGRGELAMGEQIGTIDIRGKQHPVYDKVTIGQAPESAQIRFMPEQPAVDEQTQQTRINEPGRTAADIGVRPDEARNRGGQRTARGYSPLSGAPNVFGRSGPIERISDVADRYAESRGIAVRKQAAYVGADVERGRRIAEEYAKMPHDPQNPRVQEAYADLIRQSGDQYNALVEDGYKAWFIDPANDPYEGKPWRAMRDLRENESMGVFPTEAGFGSGDTELNVADNPLLGDSGLKWPYGSPDGPLKRVLWNDVFRYIHDAFGHGIEGAGFRADGEENAWQAHVRLFDGPAVGAMTSETRGQNSWLNFGPHAEKNKTASVEETVFADQKTGLMPEWTWNEGVAPDEPLLKNTESSKSPSAPELTETGLVIAKTDKAGQPEPFKLTQDVLTRFMPAQGVNIEDYADRTVICLPADRMGIGQMFVGPTGKKKELSVEGQGGRGFMNIFRNGGWAFSERGAASSLLKRLKTVAGDEDSAIVAVTAMSPINHLKNQTGQLGYVEALRAAIDAKTISKKQANAHIKSISDAIIKSSAKSIKDATREKFKDITSLDELEKAVKAKSLNFGDAEPLLQQMQRKTHPISFKEASEMGISFQDVARDLADPEIVDLPFGSVVSLLEIPWKQQPEKTDFHYSYPWTIEGKVIGHLKSFPMIGDLSSDPRIRNKAGLISAQPLQTVLPILDKIK